MPRKIKAQHQLSALERKKPTVRGEKSKEQKKMIKINRYSVKIFSVQVSN